MRVVLTGAGGKLGRVVLANLREDGHEVTAWSRVISHDEAARVQAVDLTDRAAIDHALDHADPEAVIHLAAISSTETARNDPDLARSVNSLATARIASWCNRRLRRLLYTSTDMVFDGSGRWYAELDQPLPKTVYGQTKLAGEAPVIGSPRGLVTRLSLLYGPTTNENPGFFDQAIDRMRQGLPQVFFDDEYRTPLLYSDAARALLALLQSDTTGLIHLAGRDRLSRYELMRRVAIGMNLDPTLVRASSLADIEFPEPRPADLSLDTTRFQSLLPDQPRRPPERLFEP